MVSLSDMIPVFEDKIGFKCDESFLEDSAIRLLKASLKKKGCSCSYYRLIFVDLDDPTIILQRFIGNLKQLFSDS